MPYSHDCETCVYLEDEERTRRAEWAVSKEGSEAGAKALLRWEAVAEELRDHRKSHPQRPRSAFENGGYK